MPGIVALITKAPKEKALALLQQMVKTISHESFYTTGTWMAEECGVYVGWAARQGSFSENMPVQNESGDVALVFSGEEFAEPGQTQRLRQKGHCFETTGPSYLVHLYEDDPAFPSGLNGRFHGLVVDRRNRTATLFNDRYGMHRIYWHESSTDGFYIASEAKGILAVCPDTRRMNPVSFGEYVSCGAVLENRTLFTGINVLPPASAWTFRNGSIEKRGSYFDPKEWEEQESLDPESYYSQLRTVFEQNLPRYFNGEGRIGMALTGGLDTRMIMAWRKPQPGSLPCYTFGGMLRDCQDVILARQVARLCAQPHQVLRVGSEFLSRFNQYAERTMYLTDGCVDVGRSPDLYLSQRVREITPVRMTGQYGGEVLRQVRAFKPEPPPLDLFDPEFQSHVRQTEETYARHSVGHPVSFSVFKQAPWYHYGLVALDETQHTMRLPYFDNDFVRTVFRAPKSTLATNEMCLRLIEDGNKALLRIPTDRGIGGAGSRLARAASRARLGFFFKAEYAYDLGMPQTLATLDHALSPLHLERLFLGRHKIFHFRTWYRDLLGEYVREMLLDSRSLARPYINRRSLEAVVRDHLRGTHNHTVEIHKALSLEIVQRLFFDAR